MLQTVIDEALSSSFRLYDPLHCDPRIDAVAFYNGTRQLLNFWLMALCCRPLIMNKPKIIAYLKPSCGWSQGVRAIMRKYDLPFEDRDIINDPLQRQEMIEKSGQMLSPCVEVDGHMLPDISGEEVEAYLLSKNLVQPVNREADSPTNQPCAHEMPSAPLNFATKR